MFRKIKRNLFMVLSVLFLSTTICCTNNLDNNEDDSSTVTLSVPTGVTVSASSTAINYVTVKWTDNGAAYYWIYYNTTNDSSTATITKKSSFSGTYDHDIYLSASGTYYFWVKAANGNSADSATSGFSDVASYVFTYENLLAPTKVTATASSTKNYVNIKWTVYGAAYYWIYYNTTNDSSTATIAKKSFLSGTHDHDVYLSTSGTYYFWVKATDGYSDTSVSSDFSAGASYVFTYETLSVPTGVTVSALSTTNKVTVKWTDNGAAKYWVYYSATNDSSSATCVTKYSSSGTSGQIVPLSASGTYYFWVKSADGYSDKSVTSGFSDVVSYVFTYE